MKRTEFVWLIRDALTNLHDQAALETHPLAIAFPKPVSAFTSRGQHLRGLLLGAVEKLRPTDGDPSPALAAWRPYLILQGRYIEGAKLQELENRLALSTRQLCREHGRALRALASLLQDQAILECDAPEIDDDSAADAESSMDDFGAFALQCQVLNPAEVLRTVVDIFRPRAKSVEVALELSFPDELPTIQADRIVLRQILLAMLSHALRVRAQGDITVGADVYPHALAIWIRYYGEESSAAAPEEEQATLPVARHWVQRFAAKLQVVADGQSGRIRSLVLTWPRADQPALLVVDDQEAAIRLFQRYLSRTGLRVVGVSDPAQVLPISRQLQPRAITMDVMMPTTDGWEILQSLRADPDTRHIPVVVCSVWDVPELAASFGAAGFLKKPITQKDLLGTLARLGLLGADGKASAAVH